MHNMAAVKIWRYRKIEYAVNTQGSPLNFLQENLCCMVEQSVCQGRTFSAINRFLSVLKHNEMKVFG